MKVVVREAAAGDLDDILDWISSSVARMSEATFGAKRTLASDFALRAPGYASSYEQSAQAEPGEGGGGCWCGVGQHGGRYLPSDNPRAGRPEASFCLKSA